jgi:hypothetical protein
MADRSIHYEAAFEAYLRERAVPYVAVDEAKRALFADAKLKSFDFVVYSRAGPNLLVDVKGRSARSRGAGGSPKSFESWATQRDVDDLLHWQQVFGDGFSAVLGFTYWIDAPLIPEPGHFEFARRWYWLMGVELNEYRARMKRRSAKWETVCLGSHDFRQLARPLESWL